MPLDRDEDSRSKAVIDVDRLSTDLRPGDSAAGGGRGICCDVGVVVVIVVAVAAVGVGVGGKVVGDVCDEGN